MVANRIELPYPKIKDQRNHHYRPVDIQVFPGMSKKVGCEDVKEVFPVLNERAVDNEYLVIPDKAELRCI
ncbi:MAG: hypothetical protein AAB267_04975 [Candidatus Desantisbacteria bacterium]